MHPSHLRPRAALLAALASACLPGCSAGLAGDWYGTCAFTDERYGYTGAVQITVADGRGQRLEGRTRFDMYDGDFFRGDMEGIRSDRYVLMEAAVTNSRQEPWRFDVEGELSDEGTIEGTCALRYPDNPGAGLTGDVVLEQP